MPVVVVSGYYNPIHRGHIDYFRLAREYAGPDGTVYAIVNSDKQAILKKSCTFIPEADRLAIVSALRYVDRAVVSIDTDRTVCETLKHMCEEWTPRPTHFANGGDVTPGSPCPEEVVCREHGLELVYGLGDKIQSSSWILDAFRKV